MNIPELRFPEFEGEWEKKKLGEVTDSISSGKSNNKLAFGEFPFYGSTGLIGYTNNYGYTGKIILIARVGANAGSLYKVDGKYSVSDNTLMLKINDKGILDFVQYYLNKYDLNKLVFGSGQPLITGGHLKELSLYFPDLPEQSKIATFLTAVDEKLQALKKKKSLLEVYKKGVMQKLFSQELRFKNEDGKEFGDWEEKKLGEIVSNKSRKYNPEKENQSVKCIELEHLGSETSQLLGYIDGKNSGSMKNKFEKFDVLFGKLRPYLKKYLLAPFDGVCSSEIWVLKGINISNEFLFYIVQTDTFIDLTNQSSGSKMPRADWNVVKNGDFSVPSLPEQTLIANFLTSLDEKINHTQSEITKTEVWKKGLLQKMFV